MLKMYAAGTDQQTNEPVKIVILGLSHNNLDKLREGRPIRFTGDTCGLDKQTHFVIFAGATEQSMQQEIQSLVGPDTKVAVDPRLKT
jgi:hypothetical protein